MLSRSRLYQRTSLTIVLCLGSSSIVDETTHQPILSIISLIVETACKLRKDGHRVVIVSSGAIAIGLQRMKLPKRPKHLPQVQVRLASTTFALHATDRTSGFSSARSEQVDVTMGFAFRASRPASCPNPSDSKRHCRPDSVSQCTEYHVRASLHGCDPYSQRK